MHYDVLKLRCRILRSAKKWEDLELLACSSTQHWPNVLPFWMEWAWAQHSQGRTHEAVELLLTQTAKFPTSAALCYEIARFCCVLERIPEAEKWIQESFSLSSDPGKRKLKALDDRMLDKLRTGLL
jgi:hypothetical protein